MIRRHLLSLWDVYARPTKGFATFAEQPPFGAALLLILILGTVTALTGLHPGTDSTVRYAQALTGDAPLYRQAGVYALTFLQMLLGAALIAWLCARLLRDRIRFEVVFAALAFAALPWLCVALAYPLAVQNRLAYDAVQLFAACILLWIGVLAGIGLHIACKLERWKAALITLPLALAFLALGFNTFRSAPATFAITYPFQRWEGSHIVLYYPQGKSREEIAGFGRQTETTLNQVCKTLAVAPPSFKICVYLFPDVRLHREATGGGQDPAETDYAFANCLTMPYRPWKDCGNAMAHELTHIIVENRIASSVHGMIDEGLANYVASGIAPDYREPAAIPSTDLPLKVLARGERNSACRSSGFVAGADGMSKMRSHGENSGVGGQIV